MQHRASLLALPLAFGLARVAAAEPPVQVAGTSHAAARATCGDTGYVAPVDTRLELVASQARGRAELRIGIRNVGATPVCVWSHYESYGYSPWLSATFQGRTRTLFGGVDKSTRDVAVELQPGQTRWSAWHLPTWFGTGLTKGTSDARLTYDTSNSPGAWRGVLQTSTRVHVR